jgi:hypothetical protein
MGIFKMIITVKLDNLLCTNTKIMLISIEISNHDINQESLQQKEITLV